MAKQRGLVPPDLELNTLPSVFNRAGFATMRTCKTGNSYEAANRLFTVRKDAMKRGGTDESGSAWHAEQVLDYLGQREAARPRDPFLIYFGFSHPHDIRDGTPELLAKYGAVNHDDPDTLPPANPKAPKLPENYLPAHPFHHGHPNLRDEVAVSGVWRKRDERTIRNELGREFACSENIDSQIGRVLAKLEAMGEIENTYLCRCSVHRPDEPGDTGAMKDRPAAREKSQKNGVRKTLVAPAGATEEFCFTPPLFIFLTPFF